MREEKTISALWSQVCVSVNECLFTIRQTINIVHCFAAHLFKFSLLEFADYQNKHYIYINIEHTLLNNVIHYIYIIKIII